MDSRNPGQAALSRLVGSRVVRGAILVVLFSLLSLQDATAHDPGLSSLTIRQRTNEPGGDIDARGQGRGASLQNYDEDHDGIVTQVEFAQTRSQLETAVARQLFIAADGKVAKAQSVRSRLDENNNVEVLLNFDAIVFSSLEIQSKLIASLPLGHRQYLQVQNSTGETRLRTVAERDRRSCDRAKCPMPMRVLSRSKSLVRLRISFVWV